MIISHKYKFIFIKTVKTASTSIEVFLSQFCDDNDVVTPIYPHVEPHVARNYKGWWNPLSEIIEHRGRGLQTTLTDLRNRNKFYNHISARVAKCRIADEIWNDYFKFCVERNPWDKSLSHYHMLNDRAGGTLTLEQYINDKIFCVNYPLYTHPQKGLLVNKIIKFEQLEKDLAEVFAMLGIPFNGSLGVWAKSEHRKDKRPYKQVYTEKQRDQIGRAFSREIQMHGYTYLSS